MLVKFICPDNTQIKCEDCVSGNALTCRFGMRCAPWQMIKRIVDGRRQWTGMPSVTQLINDTRQESLKIRHEYAQRPDDAILALVGTFVHDAIEMEIPRMTQKVGLFTGKPDWYDEESATLIDYKVSTKSKLIYKDYDAYQLQLNMYRILLAESGKPVEKMRIGLICRDGKMGTDTIFNWIDIQKIQDDVILEYARIKKDALLSALGDDKVGIKCEKTYKGVRCKLCPVSGECGASKSDSRLDAIKQQLLTDEEKA